jgi:hypothetical protein
MKIFTLTITLGNDAMRKPSDIAEALRTLADKLNSGDAFDETNYEHAYGFLRDINGNRVGEWKIKWRTLFLTPSQTEQLASTRKNNHDRHSPTHLCNRTNAEQGSKDLRNPPRDGGSRMKEVFAKLASMKKPQEFVIYKIL